MFKTPFPPSSAATSSGLRCSTSGRLSTSRENGSLMYFPVFSPTSLTDSET